MSMCLVLECWTRFCVILIALSLSHSKGTFLNLIPKLFKVAFIQSNCAQQLLALMYSASVVDSTTLFCFFDYHETRDLPSNWQVPLVLILSILHPPQSESKYPRWSRWMLQTIQCLLELVQMGGFLVIFKTGRLFNINQLINVSIEKCTALT